MNLAMLVLYCLLSSRSYKYFLIVFFLFTMQKHHDNCLYSDVQCLRCGENVQKKALEEHKLSLCLYRPVKCEFCEGEIPQAKMEVSLFDGHKTLLRNADSWATREAMREGLKQLRNGLEFNCQLRLNGNCFKRQLRT